MSATFESARRLVARGWKLIAAPRGLDSLTIDASTATPVAPDQLEALQSMDQNLLLVLGKIGGGLVALHLKALDAVALAATLLPSTGIAYGPPDQPSTYRLFVSQAPRSTKEWEAQDGSPIAELLGDGSAVVVPPCIDALRRPLSWSSELEPTAVDPGELDARTGELCAAVVLVRAWPKDTKGRRNAAQALVGGLIRAKWPNARISRFIGAITNAAGDDKSSARVDEIAASEKAIAAGGKHSGWPVLKKNVEAASVQQACEWLDISVGQPAKAEDEAKMPAYRATATGFVQDKGTGAEGDEVYSESLCNFTAEIVTEIVRDDGTVRDEMARESFYEIRAHVDGEQQTFTMPASEFYDRLAGLKEQIGHKAVILRGREEDVRNAIQLTSLNARRRVVHTHTGWALIEGVWRYLHAGGYIGGAGGLGIEVELPHELSNYELPDLSSRLLFGADDHLKRSIRASLDMLKVAPLRISVPLFCATYRAALGSSDFTVFLVGGTGGMKSELASLSQRHYGKLMDSRHLPAAWKSTANANETLAYYAKDAVFTIDDFKPGGTSTMKERQHQDADHIIRGQGNNSGRARLGADGKLRPSAMPRGTVLSTGEDVPKGESTRARMVIIDVKASTNKNKDDGDVNVVELTRCQQDATSGLYAESMAGFIAKLAPIYGDVRQYLAGMVSDSAKKFRTAGHARTPDIAANLFVGAQAFLSYATATGAIDPNERLAIEDMIFKTLLVVTEAQSAHVEASDPAQQFIRLLGDAILMGRAHMEFSDPSYSNKNAWGWQLDGRGWQKKGDCIGLVEGTNVYLIPSASFSVAQRLGRETDHALNLTESMLHKNLRDKGLLVTTEEKTRKTLTVRKSFGGVRASYLHLSATTFGVDSSNNVLYAPAASTGALAQAQSLAMGDDNGSLATRTTSTVGQVVVEFAAVVTSMLNANHAVSGPVSGDGHSGQQIPPIPLFPEEK